MSLRRHRWRCASVDTGGPPGGHGTTSPHPPGDTMALYDTPIAYLDGTAADLHELDEKAVLIVNVASKCGLTPQYEGLERLQGRYGDKGFTVLGVPCNQFMGQEPGSAEEIQ